jgi:ATP-binding cassette subfamily B protein
MIAMYYGRDLPIEELRAASNLTREGVSLLNISEAAESLGFRSLAVKTSLELLEEAAVLPLIVHWRKRHFVIVYKISADEVYVADPGSGLINYPKKEFLKMWSNATEDDHNYGFALVLEPLPTFYEQ